MKGLKELDRVLRGDAAKPGASLSLLPLLAVNLLLAAFYGVCMGIYGLSGREVPENRMMIADAIKVPLLFLLTLVVTFPSLYVFNALVGSRLTVGDLARLITAGLGVLLAVLAAFGPIVGFFSVTTNSYPFVVLLNVAVFTLAAAFGLTYLIRTLDSLLPKVPLARRFPYPEPVADAPATMEASEAQAPVVENEPQLMPPPSRKAARIVLYVWLVVFALVGAQMSWVLRPFIGAPTMEFAWYRPRESSFFEGVIKAVRLLFS